MQPYHYSQTIVIGAGAAGLFCAIQLAKQGFQVTILDNGNKIGRKILMSGGGFCNFTNLEINPQQYLSQNIHFVKSALARFTQWDIITFLTQQGVEYTEKEHGQLFCRHNAKMIVDIFAQACQRYGVNIQLRQHIHSVNQLKENSPHTQARFCLSSHQQLWLCQNLVVATGGLSMPKLGATPFGYQLAEQFGLNVISPRASLVPLTYLEQDKKWATLTGISLPVRVTAQCGKTFQRDLLFTHRGLSGPAILQISNYWQLSESVEIDLSPFESITHFIAQHRIYNPKVTIKNTLNLLLPNKLVQFLFEHYQLDNPTLANVSQALLQRLTHIIHYWQFIPNGTEGYRTAEATLGGVDTHHISSKTMEATTCEGLYFIGEVLDVTGHLGGFNFQWAWSSAFACAKGIMEK